MVRVGDRAVEVPPAGEGQQSLCEGEELVDVDLDRSAVIGESLVILPLSLPRLASQQEALGVLGPDADGLGQLGDCGVKVAASEELFPVSDRHSPFVGRCLHNMWYPAAVPVGVRRAGGRQALASGDPVGCRDRVRPPLTDHAMTPAGVGELALRRRPKEP